jgi:N6-adenosine-specific RNA methylase IME4
MEDGVIFIWTTNAKGTLVSNMMASIGCSEKELLTWSKYDKNGEPLFRGGHDMMHVNERLYEFRRTKPINASDRFQILRAAPNAIHSII